MKKVIVLTMVLAATAFAADLNVAIQGPTEMDPGEAGQIELVLVGDAAATATLDTANMLMKIEAAGADLEITNIAMNANLEDIGNMPTPATMGAADGYQVAFWGPYDAITADYVAFTFDITALEGEGDITISLYPHNVPQSQHNSAETVFESMTTGTAFDGATTPLTVHVTPEPASLALLAIGGLAVIRRR